MKNIFLLIVCGFWLLTGCQNNAGTDQATLTVSVAPPAAVARHNAKITLPSGIASLAVTVQDGNSDTVAEGSVGSAGGSINLAVPAGVELTVLVEAFNSDQVLQYNGTATVSLQAGTVQSVVVSLVYVGAGNSAPIAIASSMTVTGTIAASALLAYDYDIPAQTLTYTIVDPASIGNAVITDTSTGAYTYTPNTPYVNSTDSFTFMVSDGQLDSNLATVSVTIVAPVANTIQRVSLNSSAAEGNGDSGGEAVSADGRYVVFHSDATNLVANDTNATFDVFVRDTLTGATTRVSVVSVSGAEANGGSLYPSISADGRYVAFESYATNLDPAVTTDANAGFDIFVHDRVTGTTLCRSLANGTTNTTGNGPSSEPSISADGLEVAFQSNAENLIVGDNNGFMDVFAYLDDGGSYLGIYRFSVTNSSGQLSAASLNASITGSSADFSTRVAYVSAANATEVESPDAIDTNGAGDVFITNHPEIGGTELASRVTTVGSVTGNAGSSSPRFSLDGTKLVFRSSATNLDVAKTNGSIEDIFVFDTLLFTTELVSQDASNSALASNHSYFAVTSVDGRYVAFESDATNLVADDNNLLRDIFVRDTTLDTTIRVSLYESGAEVSDGTAGSVWAALSADGRYVGFGSDSALLVAGDGNGAFDVFLTPTGVDASALLVSKDSNGFQFNGASDQLNDMSADGRYVVFASTDVLSADDTNGGVEDIYRHDTQTGATALVSLSATDISGDGNSFMASVSGDGRYVVFASEATNMVANDLNVLTDVFVRDMQLGTTTLVSVHDDDVTQGNATSWWPKISANGQYVAFISLADDLDPNFAEAGATGDEDVFVRDLLNNTTTAISVVGTTTGSTGASGNGARPGISADGSLVAFASDSADLLGAGGDSNSASDIFVRDWQNSLTTRVSVATLTGAEATGGGSTHLPAISADGRYVTFRSDATNLVAGDTNATIDIFVRDRQSGITTRVSVDSNEIQGNFSSDGASSISDDGRYVVFSSNASNLGGPEAQGVNDIFVRDLVAGTTAKVSLGYSGQEAMNDSYYPVISGAGSRIMFASPASNLIPWDANTNDDVFVVPNP